MSFSIRLTEREQALASAYARMHGISVGEAMKSAFFNMIEDEFDLNLAEVSLKEYEQNPVSLDVDEARKILEL